MSTQDHFHSTGYFIYRAPSVFDIDSAAGVIDDLIESTKLSPYLAIDMGEVELMTSAAVTALLWAHRRTQMLGGQMVLVALPRPAAAVLAATGIADMFSHIRSLGEVAPRPGWQMQTA